LRPRKARNHLAAEERPMARRSARPTIDAVLEEALGEVVPRVAAEIARTIADRASEEIRAALEASLGRGGRRPRAAFARSPRRGELSRWAADRRARRVPTFVIELTGLATKREIVARYGGGAVFEKGKPAPKPLAAPR
jgi:hypothetical protein